VRLGRTRRHHLGFFDAPQTESKRIDRGVTEKREWDYGTYTTNTSTKQTETNVDHTTTIDLAREERQTVIANPSALDLRTAAKDARQRRVAANRRGQHS